MAKICPISNKAVIYLTCAECEHKADCRAGRLQKPTDIKQSKSIKPTVK